MMKIGVLTFHDAHNYGALLQCYSLTKELSAYGECNVINYKNEKHSYGLIQRYRGKKQKIKAMLLYPKLKKRFHKMEQFIHRFPLTEPYSKEQLYQTPPRMDAIVTGSDQIWNCNDFNPIFFADFISDAKKISYAASFGKSVIPDAYQKSVHEMLKKYNRISVREHSAQIMLETAFDLHAEETIDPVFLQTKEEWRKVEKPYSVKGKYILVYLLEVQPIAKKLILKAKQELGLPVYAITTIRSGKEYGADKDFIDVGPEEFLWLIDHAEAVITSSFHGTSFSVIFEKKFISIPKHDTAERVVDLLENIGLGNRIAHEESTMDEIDYSNVNALLQLKIERSRKFLQDSMEESK